MKPLFLAAASAALLTSSAYADFARVEAGIGGWNATPTGELTYNAGAVNETVDVERDLGFSSQTLNYAWLYIKHPIPVIPNLRVEYTDIAFDGNADKSFSWAGQTYSVASDAEVKAKQYDAAFYYNLLDNTFWATLDMGIDFKFTDMRFDFRDPASHYSESGSLILPMFYVRGRFEIPGTGFGLEADAKYVTYDESTVSDVRLKTDYTFDISPVIQPGIEVGYRTQKFKVGDGEVDVDADVSFSGIYGGLMLRF